MKYTRVLLKLSGEALMGEQQYVRSDQMLRYREISMPKVSDLLQTVSMLITQTSIQELQASLLSLRS